MHAALVAEDLGVTRVLVPLLNADLDQTGGLTSLMSVRGSAAAAEGRSARTPTATFRDVRVKNGESAWSRLVTAARHTLGGERAVCRLGV